MIIGFLGKGGSGKSTLSYRFICFLESQGKRVLAIDADHNMDLLYNFEARKTEAEKNASDETVRPADKLNYIGQALSDLKKYAGIAEEQHYSEIFSTPNKLEFHIHPPDSFTKKYSEKISDRLRLMAAGPHTDDMLYDKSCSHALITPLKAYLPCLTLKKDEFVIIDEKAGTDSVGTGITTGFDVAVIVFEPTVHSIKAAKQISSLLEFYRTPSIFVANKVMNPSDEDFIKKNLGVRPEATIHFNKNLMRPDLPLGADADNELKELLIKLEEKRSQLSRLERSRIKFEKNLEYKSDADR